MTQTLNTWESVSVNNNITTLRMKLPGGWLVHTLESTTSTTQLVFVPDETEFWEPSADIT